MKKTESQKTVEDVLIINAQIINPEAENSFSGWIYVKNGIIEKVVEGIFDIVENPAYSEAEIIDAEDNYVMPGFIDIHAHGAGGASFYTGNVDENIQVAKAKLKEGVTTVLPTTLTQSKEDLEKALTALKNTPKEGLPNMPGVHLEGPYIATEKAGAQNPKNVRPPSVEEVEKLNDIFPVKIVSLAPEKKGAIDFIKAMKKKKIITSIAHSSARAEESQEAITAGTTHFTHLGNAMTPCHHRNIGAVGVALKTGSKTYGEIISDGIHSSPDFVNLVLQNKTAKGVMAITDCTAASGTPPNGDIHDLAGIKTIVKENKDGLCEIRLAENPEILAGAHITYIEGIQRMKEMTKLSIYDLVQVSSTTQSDSLRFNKGRIENGKDADFVILNPEDLEVQKTIVGGELLFEK